MKKKNIAKHITYIILSWPIHKQWFLIHISYFRDDNKIMYKYSQLSSDERASYKQTMGVI